MGTVIEVNLLGPPRVERDGTLVAFDTRKALAVLALLSVADRPRTRDGLADLLWPGNDPTHARGALRRTLSALRNAVGGDLLEATSDHVRLVKGDNVAVDVDRFRDLAARGQLESAVALFRGDFLEGFAVRDAPDFEDWVRSEGDGLHRQLTSALAALTEAREAEGDRLGALTYAQRWLSVDNLHEPAHRAIIRLYASMGDRAAALSQYRECVRALGRDLGVDPLAETTRLYEAVLRGSYEAPPRESGPPKEAAVRPPPFVGRSADLAALQSQYAAVESDGRVVLVEGEPGIGKTRLAVELLTRIRREQARVLGARAYEDEAGLAYAPVVEMIRARLREGREWLDGVSDGSLREAARLVPELLSGRSVDAAPEIPQPGAEIRFLSGVWDTILAATSGPVPGALFVDDAQWADDATLGLLAYGLRRLSGRCLLVVLTWRTPHEHPLRRAVLSAVHEGQGVAVQLRRLDLEAVGALVRAAGRGVDDPDDVRRLWELSEGVPLLLVEYLRSSDGEDAVSLPTGVRELLRIRLDRVSETGRQVLAAAAVLGRSFGADGVRLVSGRTEEETVAALEEVVRRGLVVERRFDYDFVHELQRRLVYEDTGLARRRLLHGRAAKVPGAPAGAMARHLQLAGRDAEAADAYRTAGLLARDVFANAEAVEHLRTALTLGHPDRIGLQVAIGDLQTVMGSYAEALLTLDAAASVSGPDDLAAVEQRLGRLQYRRGEHEVAAAHFQAALEALPDLGPGSASLTADLSLAVHALGDVRRARELADRARELAGAAGEDLTVCQADNILGMLATEEGDLDGAVIVLGRCRELADRLGDTDLRVAALNNLALAHRARRELEIAIRLTREALELCTTTGDRHHEAALHNNLADLLHLSGQSEPAMEHLKSAVELLAEIGAQEEPRAGIWKLVRW